MGISWEEVFPSAVHRRLLRSIGRLRSILQAPSGEWPEVAETIADSSCPDQPRAGRVSPGGPRRSASSTQSL